MLTKSLDKLYFINKQNIHMCCKYCKTLYSKSRYWRYSHKCTKCLINSDLWHNLESEHIERPYIPTSFLRRLSQGLSSGQWDNGRSEVSISRPGDWKLPENLTTMVTLEAMCSRWPGCKIEKGQPTFMRVYRSGKSLLYEGINVQAFFPATWEAYST